MDEHTPGPWVLCRCDGHDGSAVATIEPKPETMEGPNHWAVAHTNTLRNEWQANARLIAAAPDLLAACRAFVAKVDRGEARSVNTYAQMVAAIAKATGAEHG